MTEIESGIPDVLNRGQSFVDFVQYWARHQSQQVAYSFLQDGEAEEIRWTYASLDRRSRAIAAQLQAYNLRGERALLLYPPGVDYLAAFLGCLYAGVVAVPAYPPRNQRNTPRVLAVVQDAQVTIALTTAAILPTVRSLLQEQAGLRNLQWLATDKLSDELAEAWRDPIVNRETLAFLQYTSGSTGTPKGVMVSHANLLHNAAMTYRYMGHSPQSRFVSWLPMYHDMGLIGGVLQPLYGGFPCILMAPAAFLQRPYRWLKAISDYGATTSGGPNFAYDLCVEKITPEQRQTLNLSSWKVAFNGAEPIRAETLERFAATFGECGFRPEAAYPCYGMAEATLMVSGVELATEPNVQALDVATLEQNQVLVVDEQSPSASQWVSCGRSLPDQAVAIVQPDTGVSCGPDQVGEIWVAGPSVAQGYWQRPQETQETFQAYVVDTGAGPFLRTGDLGFLHQGELYITGRAKDLIIVRGRNLYPQDIEHTAERSHAGLRAGSGAAFAVEVGGEEHLVVVQELEFRQSPDTAVVMQAIRQAVTEEHEIQVYGVVLVKAGTIPKTTSGKIQRRACRAAFLAGQLTVVAQDLFTPTQVTAPAVHLNRASLLAAVEGDRPALLSHYLQAQIAQALQRDPQQVDGQQPLSSLGLDSLRVFSLRSQIETDLGWDLPIADLFSGITLAELVQQGLRKLENSPAERQLPPLQPLPQVSSNYPLSFPQQRLWFLDQLDPGNPAYNIALMVQLQGDLNPASLAQSLNEILRRHESLRTTFPIYNGQPVQVIAEALEVPLVQVDLQAHSETERQAVAQQRAIAQLQQPFDLSEGPLLRATLLHLSPTESWLVLAMHHILSDGHSMEVLYQELTAVYPALASGNPSPLAPLPIQYKDFSHWQQQGLQGAVRETQLAYWQQQLAGAPMGLALPSDRPRPAVLSSQGSHETCRISPELTEQLHTLSRQAGVTLFMTLLAAWQTLLYRYSGQTDICVGTPLAHRQQPELKSLIGFFVNTLVLRTDLSGNPSFRELLQRVRQVALGAYAHQDLPFEQLVQALQPQRHASYTPLFQVMLTLQSDLPRVETANLTWRPQPLHGESAQLDLSLDVTLTITGMEVSLEYSTDLFDAPTITAMLAQFQTLLAGVCHQPDQLLLQLPLLSASEQQQVLQDWTQTQREFPQVAGIHHLFEAQVEQTPEAIAVVWQDQSLTYAELNQQANQLAHYLCSLGIQLEQRVGLYLERSLDLLIGVLGVLKGGAAYVPLDPLYSQERLAFMLQQSHVSVVVTHGGLSVPSPTAEVAVTVVDLSQQREVLQQQPTNNPFNYTTAENLAYVIYTSGSTGQPKGVMVEHRSLINAYFAWEAAYCLRSEARSYLQMASFSFDVFTGDWVRALCSGGKLVLCPRNVLIDPPQLYNLIQRQQIDCAEFVPAVLRSLTQFLTRNHQRLDSLKLLICGSDTWTWDDYQQLQQLCPATTRLINSFGVTEATIDSSYFEGTIANVSQGQWVPIGHPFANTQLYVLDATLQPVPIGVAGELYIGGAGLARGYLGRPDLTAEQFIPHPFSKESGARLYKTGDLARWRRDGNVEFLGRADDQVKLHGFRIELGEIEAVLTQHSVVQTAVVVVRSLAGQKQLVAYVVPESAAAIPNAPEASFVTQLQQDLRQQLPDYLVPSAVVLLPGLPLTPNGKIDRRALPEPAVAMSAAEPEARPQTGSERLIAQIWQTLLQVPRVGLQDNFFDLGGHSLLMAQVQFQLQEQLQQEVSVVELFQYPTVQALAQYLNSKTPLMATTQPAFQSARDRAQRQKSALNRQRKFRNQG